MDLEKEKFSYDKTLERIRKDLDTALTFLDYEKASQLIKKGLKKSKLLKNKFYQYYFKAESLILKEDYKKAIKYFDKALKINPYDAETYNDKALCLADLKELDKALECIELGLKLAGEHKILYHNKGWILMEKEMYEKAIIYFKKALEFDTSHSVSWANLAECLKIRGDFEEALESYKKALKFVPKNYPHIRERIKKEISALKKFSKK